MDVPAPPAWLRALGVEPRTEAASGDDLVEEVVLAPSPDEQLHLTWSTAPASVRVRWSQGGVLRVDIYREGVERLLLDDSQYGVTRVVAEYRAPDSGGRLSIQTWPAFSCEDAWLRGG